MLSFLFLLAIADAKPQFMQMKQGEIAPFDGRLLNDEAITKIAIEDKFKVEQCEFQISYSLEKQKLFLDYENLQKTIKLESDINILKTKLDLRDNRIKALESLKTSPNPFWYTTAGFLVGSAATIAITYSVNQ